MSAEYPDVLPASAMQGPSTPEDPKAIDRAIYALDHATDKKFDVNNFSTYPKALRPQGENTFFDRPRRQSNEMTSLFRSRPEIGLAAEIERERDEAAHKITLARYNQPGNLQAMPPHGDPQLQHDLENARRYPSKNPILTVATLLVEMIPGGIGPYGIGDIITALEAAAGRTIDGLHLTGKERLIYIGASVIPVLPARPFIFLYRQWERARARQESLQ